MVKPVLLVDFDGVVVKNAQAVSYVGDKAARFVANRVALPNLSIAKDYNRELYTGHGHTLLGLRKHGHDVHLREYNEYLYGDVSKYSHLSLNTYEHIDWKAFLEAAKNMDFDVKFFSNSSSKWMSHFLPVDDTTYSMYEFQWYLESMAHQNIFNTMLKPHRNMYDTLMYSYPGRTYHFVDDKVANFAYVQDDPRWSKYWFTNNTFDNNIYTMKKRMYCVGSLRDVVRLMDKNNAHANKTY